MIKARLKKKIYNIIYRLNDNEIIDYLVKNYNVRDSILTSSQNIIDKLKYKNGMDNLYYITKSGIKQILFEKKHS